MSNERKFEFVMDDEKLYSEFCSVYHAISQMESDARVKNRHTPDSYFQYIVERLLKREWEIR